MSLQITIREESNILEALQGQLRQNTGMVTRKHALKMEARIEASMREPKSGHAYGEHRASAPGEAPAVQSGKLIGSVEAVKVEPYTWSVGSADEKAPILEFGGKNTAPRPAFLPAADETWDELQDDMKRVLEG